MVTIKKQATLKEEKSHLVELSNGWRKVFMWDTELELEHNLQSAKDEAVIYANAEETIIKLGTENERLEDQIHDLMLIVWGLTATLFTGFLFLIFLGK